MPSTCWRHCHARSMHAGDAVLLCHDFFIKKNKNNQTAELFDRIRKGKVRNIQSNYVSWRFKNK